MNKARDHDSKKYDAQQSIICKQLHFRDEFDLLQLRYYFHFVQTFVTHACHFHRVVECIFHYRHLTLPTRVQSALSDYHSTDAHFKLFVISIFLC